MNNIIKRKTKRKLRPYGKLTPYMFLLPALLILGIFVFYPLIRVIMYSFQSYNVFTPPEWIGTKNYENIIKDKAFLAALKNTVLYFIIVVPTLVVLPVFVAILVNSKLKGIKFFRASYYLPVITSMVVAGIAWKWIYADSGLLNYLLVNILHIIKKPIPFLTSKNTALYSVMIVTIWKGIGYYMVIYLSGLQAISQDIWEAAEIDGASGLKKHLFITFPLLAPSMAIVAVMSSMAAMKVFDEIYIMTGGGPFNSTKTVVYYLYERAFSQLEMGYASAVGVILFLILLVFSIISIKISDKKVQ
ncbi:carbohydrate ABC transporter permease [Clostridium sp.]|uniref:carbohydrate ABC transporter permease n=1 Tax=Clostridium sp. TaxID=1506 RepID=UPI003D6D76DD